MTPRTSSRRRSCERGAAATASAQGFTPEFGRLRTVVTEANGQPAVAHYLRAPGKASYRPLALDVLRVEGGLIAEITSFVSPELFAAFGLADEFPAEQRST